MIIYLSDGTQIQVECKNRNEAKDLLRRLTKAAPSAFYGFHKELKAAWSKDRKAIVQAVRNNEATFKKMLKELLSALDQGDVQASIAIIDALGENRYRQAVRYLVMILQHPDPSIKLHTIQALGKIADPESVSALESLNVPQSGSEICLAKAKAIEQININNL